MKLEEIDRDVVREAAWAISRVLPWVESKKGGKYWQDVYEELIRIAKTGEP